MQMLRLELPTSKAAEPKRRGSWIAKAPNGAAASNSIPEKSLVMKKNSPIRFTLSTVWSVFALVGLSGSSVLADIVIEPRAGGQNTSWYSETAGAWSDSSATVTPAGTGGYGSAPGSTGGTIGSRFSSAAGVANTSPAFALNPTVTSTHVYELFTAIPSTATSESSTVVLGISGSGFTGLPTTTTTWQYSSGLGKSTLNTWRSIGTLTASSANPSISFVYSSGTVSRTYAGAFRLADQACLTPAVGGINGPLTNGQTVVSVFGCSASATKVYVYANNDGTHGTCIGTNSAPGGQTTVVVNLATPLAQGQYLQANQLVGCEGPLGPGNSGPVVGSGHNGALGICLELTGGTTANAMNQVQIWLGASGRAGGSASPPTGTQTVTPGIGWQTLTWTVGTDPAWCWQLGTSYALPASGYASLDAIWFASQDSTETGPYTVYIDNIKNGDRIIRDSESDTVGASTLLNVPGFSASGNTALNNAPNTANCVNNLADVGTKCQQVSWQWTGLGPNGVRDQATTTLPAPIFVDLSQPITMRVLVLPAGASLPALKISQPAAAAITPAGGSVTITATDNSGAITTPVLTYQWKKNGVVIDAGNAGDLSGYDTASLVFPAAPSVSDAGFYSCLVTDPVLDGPNPGTYTAECDKFLVSIVQSGVALGTGTGLRGDYRTLHTNDNPFTGAVTLTRVDPTVDGYYGNNSPASSSISVDWFTARWYGQVKAMDTDTYTFDTFCDDGVRVWVNNQLVVDHWALQAPTHRTGTIALTANQQYPIVMEYFENQAGAQSQLGWSTAGGGLVSSVIPASQLTPGASWVQPTVTLTPANNATVNSPATVTATVVTNSAAEITSVKFFTNDVLLATAPTTLPYTYSWAAASGVYNLRAEVLYDKSTVVYSTTNAVTVQAVAPVTGFGITNNGAGSLSLGYSGGAGVRWVLLGTNDLNAPMSNWTRLQTNTSTPGFFPINAGTDPAEFYRVKTE
jgi:hypothetical protein